MQAQYPFCPVPTAANTLAQAVTGSSATFTLPSLATGTEQSIVFTNVGTQTVFWAWGTVTASVTTSMPIIANTAQTIAVPYGVTTISVIAGSTGSTLYLTLGTGI
jgi:hypothetical protein